MEAYLGITDEDRRDAAAAWAIIEPCLDDILDQFYADAANAVFLPCLSPELTACLKQSQKLHWQRVFGGGSEEEMEQSSRLVGLRHRQHQLAPSGFVLSYMKMLSLFFAALQAADRAAPAASRHRRSPILKTVALDMGYALAAYGAELVD